MRSGLYAIERRRRDDYVGHSHIELDGIHRLAALQMRRADETNSEENDDAHDDIVEDKLEP